MDSIEFLYTKVFFFINPQTKVSKNTSSRFPNAQVEISYLTIPANERANPKLSNQCTYAMCANIPTAREHTMHMCTHVRSRKKEIECLFLMSVVKMSTP